MEKEATTQEDAAHAREGVGALKWLASAVGASVCGVVGNHLGRLLALGLGLGEVWPEAPEVIWPKLFSGHSTLAFFPDRNSEFRGAWLVAVHDVAHVTQGRSALHGERFPVRLRHV